MLQRLDYAAFLPWMVVEGKVGLDIYPYVTFRNTECTGRSTNLISKTPRKGSRPFSSVSIMNWMLGCWP